MLFLVLYYLVAIPESESILSQFWINSENQFCHSSNSFIRAKHDFSCCSILSLFSFSLQFSPDEIIYSHGFQLPLHGSDSQNYTLAQVSHLRGPDHILIYSSWITTGFSSLPCPKLLLTLLSPTSASFISVNHAIYLVAQAGHTGITPDPSLCCLIHLTNSKLSMKSSSSFNRHCFCFGLDPCHFHLELLSDFSDIHDIKLVSFVLSFIVV